MFEIEHCRIKVKATVGLQKFPHLPISRHKKVYIKHVYSSYTNIQNL